MERGSSAHQNILACDMYSFIGRYVIGTCTIATCILIRTVLGYYCVLFGALELRRHVQLHARASSEVS
jgi:hypothetical protein